MIAAPPLILASASAARARLLAGAGVPFEVMPADVDEAEGKAQARAAGLSAEATALNLAVAKGARISAARREAFVLGCDQMLEVDGRWFDKPRDVADARAQLKFLRRREQRLVSAVAVLRDEEVRWRYVEVARLVMRPFSDAFLDDYLAQARDQACASVGGCQIEGRGIQFFERIDGDFFTILGLPLLPVLAFLREEGVIGR
jgi:septum formation protein